MLGMIRGRGRVYTCLCTRSWRSGALKLNGPGQVKGRMRRGRRATARGRHRLLRHPRPRGGCRASPPSLGPPLAFSPLPLACAAELDGTKKLRDEGWMWDKLPIAPRLAGALLGVGPGPSGELVGFDPCPEFASICPACSAPGET